MYMYVGKSVMHYVIIKKCIKAFPTVNLLIILTQVYYTLGTIHDALLNKNIIWSRAYKKKHKNVYKLAIQLSAPYSY